MHLSITLLAGHPLVTLLFEELQAKHLEEYLNTAEPDVRTFATTGRYAAVAVRRLQQPYSR
ncbi:MULTISPECIES: hypothetical protein [Ramlibacter]|uniref:hypothetical protein n=1 Tax=Ramlibacter TaxID=174951 RepID=UPI00187D5268|nr:MULTISPECIES: hypothetical protein [Ramlibacter]